MRAMGGVTPVARTRQTVSTRTGMSGKTGRTRPGDRALDSDSSRRLGGPAAWGDRLTEVTAQANDETT